MQIFVKMDFKVDLRNLKACNWLKSNNSSKKVTIKLSNRKDADKIRKVDWKIKLLKLESMSINNPIFINDSLYEYYEKIWAICKTMWMNKFIQGFCASHRFIKMKLSKGSTPCIITQNVDLETFPGNPLLKDISKIDK